MDVFLKYRLPAGRTPSLVMTDWHAVARELAEEAERGYRDYLEWRATAERLLVENAILRARLELATRDPAFLAHVDALPPVLQERD